MYWFILKSAFCLTIVFVMLPEESASRVTSEVTRAVTQDRIVRATVDRAHLAVQKAVADSQKLCLQKPDECIETARQIARGAAAGL